MLKRSKSERNGTEEASVNEVYVSYSRVLGSNFTYI